MWANDGCEAAGQYIPFPATEAARAATGDPRPSVQARYPTFESYHGKVRQALEELVSERFLLCEDAGSEETRLVQHGLTRGVPAPASGAIPTVQPLNASLPSQKPGKGPKKG